MRLRKGMVFVAAVGALSMVLAGCPQKEGPLERAGKSVDKAGQSVKDAVKGDKK